MVVICAKLECLDCRINEPKYGSGPVQVKNQTFEQGISHPEICKYPGKRDALNIPQFAPTCTIHRQNNIANVSKKVRGDGQ